MSSCVLLEIPDGQNDLSKFKKIKILTIYELMQEN